MSPINLLVKNMITTIEMKEGLQKAKEQLIERWKMSFNGLKN